MKNMKLLHAENADGVAHELAAQLSEALELGKKTLWLIPGGSNIATAVFVMKTLRSGMPTSAFNEGAPIGALGNLTVALTDERYGPVGHQDSNWKQLDDAGFNLDNITAIPVLTGHTLIDTAYEYGLAISDAFNKNEVRIGFFGIGADGHIAGILPNSPAVDDLAPVCGYDAGQYERITLTPAILKNLTSAFVSAFGATKAEAILNLRDRELSLKVQPAQLIKELPEAYVFSDQA